MTITRLIPIALMAASLFASCGGGASSSDTRGGKELTRYACNLSMEERDGYTLVKVRNPWDTTCLLATYALVERGDNSAPTLPEGVRKIAVPLEKSVVYSAVHTSLIEELGATDAVTGVCDASFFTKCDEAGNLRITGISHGLNSGRIRDCGSSMQPNVEAIISTGAEAVLLSPYENDHGSHGKLEQTDISIIECADYLEKTPLARAEWMRFYGRLYGKGAKADSLFDATEKEYMTLKQKSAKAGKRPSVIFDRIYSGTWSVPTSGSVTGAMIADCGGSNPFLALNNAGSAQLSPEEVLFKGGDADVWFIRYFEGTPVTLRTLAADNPAYARFKAYKNGNVYICNTLSSDIFEDGAFHPQWVLADMIRVLHPELGMKGAKEYYKKISK